MLSIFGSIFRNLTNFKEFVFAGDLPLQKMLQMICLYRRCYRRFAFIEDVTDDLPLQEILQAMLHNILQDILQAMLHKILQDILQAMLQEILQEIFFVNLL